MSAFPRSRREEIEARLRSLRLHKQMDTGDRRELEGMIEAAEAELREIKGAGDRRLSSGGAGHG